jgi:SAM-dependent methyltransferase
MSGRGDWATPERMAEQAATGEGVFGAYEAFEKGTDEKTIGAHGIVDDAYALVYARNLRDLLRRHGAPVAGPILDVGCGIGTITHAIHAACGAGTDCQGIDLSAPAIRVARERYADCAFRVASADDLGTFADGTFSLIHAREFYPFTRSADAGLHARFLTEFAAKLMPGGHVAAVQIVEPAGLADSLVTLAGQAPSLGFESAVRRVMVPNRAYRGLGRAAYGAGLYTLVSAAGAVLESIRPGRVSYVYLFRKSAV